MKFSSLFLLLCFSALASDCVPLGDTPVAGKQCCHGGTNVGGRCKLPAQGWELFAENQGGCPSGTWALEDSFDEEGESGQRCLGQGCIPIGVWLPAAQARGAFLLFSWPHDERGGRQALCGPYR